MSVLLPLSIREQNAELRLDWPKFRTVLFEPGRQRVIWRGEVWPGINRYKIEIEYSMERVIMGPKVRVVSPSLTRLPGNPEGSLPHVYERDTDPYLCLFDPRGREWTGSGCRFQKRLFLGRLIGLVCYEGWLLTGAWHGGGRHVTGEIGMSFDLEEAR
ncbi:hypothetical protein [Xylophilus sp.]|uniref:hypothetical protein n=1 Tax=Xylophilus sp. TaxID=2653893 RepID=UPI002D80572B|nr:hypothetical protein [Xylophilus sp.]